MWIYRTATTVIVSDGSRVADLGDVDWDELLHRPELRAWLVDQMPGLPAGDGIRDDNLLAPVGSQEVWCAGVTYYRSRAARMEESVDGGDVYDRVYEAERPELFFKATAQRVVAHQQPIRVRRDSTWSVPEAELVLVIDRDANIIGYTVGNDVSARDIEGANPLYLPQAKVYDQACAVGPGIYLPEGPLAGDTTIRLRISRGDKVVFEGESSVAQIKRPFESLVEYLYRDNSFPDGCLLMTGTGIIPPDDFTLEDGDMVRIAIDEVGGLENPVVKALSAAGRPTLP